MSLKRELSADRRYVLTAQGASNPNSLSLQDAAVAILRKVIAPTFRMMHYGGDRRTEQEMRIVVDFSRERSYSIRPEPSWNFSHRGVEYTKLCNYSYADQLPRKELWEQVLQLAPTEEWEISAKYATDKDSTIIFSLWLEDESK